MEEVLVAVFRTEWHVLLILGGILVLVAELGFRLGMRLHVSHDEARKEQIGGLQAAVLGLLGLLLGFTFAMAVARYDARRDLVVQEANAIGTTYLRAQLLPEPQRTDSIELLRSYGALAVDLSEHVVFSDRFEGDSASMQPGQAA